MNNKDKYIFAMDNLKFNENLKSQIMDNINNKIENKYIGLIPKMIISVACIQFVFTFFATTSISYFLI